MLKLHASPLGMQSLVKKLCLYPAEHVPQSVPDLPLLQVLYVKQGVVSEEQQ